MTVLQMVSPPGQGLVWRGRYERSKERCVRKAGEEGAGISEYRC